MKGGRRCECVGDVRTALGEDFPPSGSEAFDAGVAPPVLLSATHERALELVPLEALKRHALDLV